MLVMYVVTGYSDYRLYMQGRGRKAAAFSAVSGRLDFWPSIDDNIYYWAGSSVGERLLDTQEVASSILASPTSKI